MKSFLINAFLVAVFIFCSAPAHALGQGVQLGHFSFDTPNDRWRIEDAPELNAIDIKHLRHGTDVTIRVTKKDAINRDFGKRRTNKGYWTKKLKKALLASYEQQGFRFSIYQQRDDNSVYAEGVDQDRNYMLLSFHFVKPNYRGDFSVVETILPNKDYMAYKDSFMQVTRSVRLK